MTVRPDWPGPVMPQCPESCCWRLTCSSDTQAGIATLWKSGRIVQPADCTFYEHRSRVHRATTGRDPPATAAELLEQLAERATIRDDGVASPSADP
jgi:hypothetical protein